MSHRDNKTSTGVSGRRIPMKVIVLSLSRNGTMGLFKALKILGYKSYHNIEAASRGKRDFPMISKAMIAEKDPSTPSFGRKEFDELWGDYDAITEICGYLAPSVIAAYMPDPDIKFILVERDPDRWVRSFSTTVGALAEAAATNWLLRLSARIDGYNAAFFGVTAEYHRRVTGGIGELMPSHGEAYADALRRHYVEHNLYIKKTIPPNRLKVIVLEDGLDWEAICPFLGKDIPSLPYPRGNDPNEVNAILSGLMRPGLRKTLWVVGMGSIVVLGLGVLASFKVWHGEPLSHAVNSQCYDAKSIILGGMCSLLLGLILGWYRR